MTPLMKEKRGVGGGGGRRGNGTNAPLQIKLAIPSAYIARQQQCPTSLPQKTSNLRFSNAWEGSLPQLSQRVCTAHRPPPLVSLPLRQPPLCLLCQCRRNPRTKMAIRTVQPRPLPLNSCLFTAFSNARALQLSGSSSTSPTATSPAEAGSNAKWTTGASPHFSLTSIQSSQCILYLFSCT